LKDMFRTLRPGGSVWVMTDFFVENPPSKHWQEMVGVKMHYMSEKDYRKLFRVAEFENIELYRIPNPTPVDEANFKPGAYKSVEELKESRQKIGSLVITGTKLVY
nr:hypothetical protein [Vampirovibrio sp.]